MHSYMGMFTMKDGGMHVLVGLAQSSQAVGYLLRTPGGLSWAEKFGQKSFGKFTSMEKCP
jgi:hypothetical protein